MSPNLKALFQLLGQHKWRYALGGLFLIGSDVGQLAIPYLVGRLIDGLVDQELTGQHLTGFALAVVGLALFTAIVRYGWRMCVFGAARTIERDLRQRLYGHLQSLPMGYHLKHKIGDLMAHATNDVQAVRGAAGEGFMAGFDALAMATLASAMMLGTVDWRLGVVSLLPMLILPGASYMIGNALHRRYKRVQEAFSTLSERVQENIAGIRVVKGFVREAQQEARFAEANQAYRQDYARMVRFERAFDPVINLLSGLSFAIGLGYGGHMVLAGTITLGQYVAFNSFLGFLIWPMLGIGWTMNILQRATASLARLQTIFETAPEVGDAPDARALAAPRGHLRLEKLTFRYAPELPAAVSDLTLDLPPGKTVGIMGGTGAGKSTVANLLIRLFNPPRGQVFLDGLDVNDVRLQDLRRAIAYVPQDSFLFSRTIGENIAFDPAPHSEDELLDAARLAQIDPDVRDFAHGYETMLGERGITLSGGQRQRISIARALIKDARVLVLDDCLSAVDTVTESKILEGLRPYMADRTTVVISHRVASLMHADEILVLAEGAVQERGTHAELLAAGGEYAALYRKQQLEAAIERM